MLWMLWKTTPSGISYDFYLACLEVIILRKLKVWFLWTSCSVCLSKIYRTRFKICRFHFWTPKLGGVYLWVYLSLGGEVPVSTMVAPSSPYQAGRSIASAYSLTNGARSDHLTYTSSVPVMSSASYGVSPGKMPSSKTSAYCFPLTVFWPLRWRFFSIFTCFFF